MMRVFVIMGQVSLIRLLSIVNGRTRNRIRACRQGQDFLELQVDATRLLWLHLRQRLLNADFPQVLLTSALLAQ